MIVLGIYKLRNKDSVKVQINEGVYTVLFTWEDYELVPQWIVGNTLKLGRHGSVIKTKGT